MSRPPRIVSLVPSLTELLFALDLGPQSQRIRCACPTPSNSSIVPRPQDLERLSADTGFRPIPVLG